MTLKKKICILELLKVITLIIKDLWTLILSILIKKPFYNKEFSTMLNKIGRVMEKLMWNTNYSILLKEKSKFYTSMIAKIL